MDVLHRIAPIGSNMISPTSQIPWRGQLAADYHYERPRFEDAFLDAKPFAVREPVTKASAAKAGATFLVVTRGQQVYASQALGRAPDWFSRVRPLLNAKNGYRLVYRNSDASIYEYRLKK